MPRLPRRRKDVSPVQRRHLVALTTAKRLVRDHPGLIGIDCGYIYENGVRTNEIGIRYHVLKKLPRRALAPEYRLPTRIEDVRTDVIEAGYKPHRADPFAPVSVLQPGLSVGNVPRQADGTLGVFVKDRQDQAVCLLSNWHVLCGGPEARMGDQISQPGPLNLGPNPPHEIAQLRRWIAPVRQYDAAIAAISPGFEADPTLLDSSIRVTGFAEPQIGMAVVKTGAATGITHALIDAVGGSYKVPYSEFGDTDRWMLGIRLVPNLQFHDTDVSQPGDSGAVWVQQDTGRAVALNFAGEDDGGPLNEYALAHSLPVLCELLDIQPVVE